MTHSPIDHASAHRPPRPQWLVSVQSIQEAFATASFAVDILDWKQPRRGPLAPVEIETWHEIESLVESSTQTPPCSFPSLSAALGETDTALAIASRLPDCFAFAKVGPSGCDTTEQMNTTWRSVRDRLPATVELVAVAYADHLAANCMSVEEILDAATGQGFSRILIDTFDKSNGSSLSHLTIDRLMAFSRMARERSIWWALAGSIGLGELKLIEASIGDRRLLPDCFAIRGALCDGERSKSISTRKLKQWNDHMTDFRNRHTPSPDCVAKDPTKIGQC